MIWLDIDLLMSYFNFRIWSPTPLLSFALYSTMVHILYILFGTVPQYPFQSQLVYILIQHVDYRSWLCARHSPRLRDGLIPSPLVSQLQPLLYSYQPTATIHPQQSLVRWPLRIGLVWRGRWFTFPYPIVLPKAHSSVCWRVSNQANKGISQDPLVFRGCRGVGAPPSSLCYIHTYVV